jgi:hypothetical protein
LRVTVAMAAPHCDCVARRRRRPRRIRVARERWLLATGATRFESAGAWQIAAAVFGVGWRLSVM